MRYLSIFKKQDFDRVLDDDPEYQSFLSDIKELDVKERELRSEVRKLHRFDAPTTYERWRDAFEAKLVSMKEEMELLSDRIQKQRKLAYEARAELNEQKKIRTHELVRELQSSKTTIIDLYTKMNNYTRKLYIRIVAEKKKKVIEDARTRRDNRND